MKKKETIILVIVATVFVVLAIVFSVVSKKSPQYPEIKFNDETLKVSVDASDDKLLEGVTAIDPEDGDVTDSLVVEGASNLVDGKKIKVVYAAFDSQNHVTKAERTVIFTNYKSPHFTLSAPMIFTPKNNTMLLTCVGAQDVFDGDISGNIKFSVEDDTSINKPGEYVVKFSVTNRLGDMVTIPITVEIVEEAVNIDAIKLTDYLVYIGKGDDFNAADYLDSYAVGGTEHKSASGLKITNNVNTEEPGVYTVDYMYGSNKSGIRTRLIVVVE